MLFVSALFYGLLFGALLSFSGISETNVSSVMLLAQYNFAWRSIFFRYFVLGILDWSYNKNNKDNP